MADQEQKLAGPGQPETSPLVLVSSPAWGPLSRRCRPPALFFPALAGDNRSIGMRRLFKPDDHPPGPRSEGLCELLS